MDEVWLVEIDAKGPEGGDYWGCRHIHAARDNAVRMLVGEMQLEFGIQEFKPDATTDNGSETGTVETADGWTVEWSLQWAPVKP